MLDLVHIADQRALEEATYNEGIRRYEEAQTLKAMREGFDRTDAVAEMIRGAVPLVAAGITKWLEAANASKGRKSAAVKPLLLLDADKLALIGTSRTFRSLPAGGRIASLVIGIGRSVQYELEAVALKNADPKAFKRFAQLAEGEASETVLMARHDRLIEEGELSLGWGDTTRAMVGQAILGVVLLELKDIFARTMTQERGQRQAVVVLTDEAASVLLTMSDAAAMARPPLQPMLTSPRPWIGLNTGCYLDHRLSRTVPLVRTYSTEHKKLLRAAIADGSMQETLDAVNAMQATRWAIDTRVLEVVKWVKEEGLKPAASFPATAVPELGEKITKEDWEAMEPAARIATSRSRKAVRDIRKGAAVDNQLFRTDLEMASFLAEYDAFYLPHSLDFRGRVYAVPSFNHQRSDHIKGLFSFADGVALGASGGEWLMIHLANTGDFSKVSKQPFEARVQWVRDNEGAILMVAEDPHGSYDYWASADSPFCFLQACFEYSAWMKSGFSQDFLSTIPVAADGSCSGLQHYSAITRSAEEAHHVNLLPRDTVGDIYQVTADAAVPTLQTAANTGCALSALILANGFGRSEVKRNVMTYFYGSGKFGMRDQHMEDTMRPLADKVALGAASSHPYSVEVERTNPDTGEVTLAHDGGYSCAAIMAAHTYQAVITVAQKADEAASWVQSVAAVLAHEGQSMVWTTQTGMPVVQRYSEYVTKQINLWLYDRKVLVPTITDKVDAEGNVLSRVRLLIREAATKRVEKKRMRSASSPNVIHSMDGAHLQRSVVMGTQAGIGAFAMIHDSFGAHAGNMKTFSAVVREAFIACYENYCPLATIDAYARSVLSDEGIAKLPPIPAKGTLDLNAVRGALYAFA